MDNNSNNYNQDIWQESVGPESQQPKKNYDTASLVLGIVSAVFALVSSCFVCCAPVPIITGIIGIIFVFVSKKNDHEWNAVRIVALVLNIVAIIGLILWFAYMIVFYSSAAGQEYLDEIMKMYEELLNDPSISGSYYE